MKKHYPKTIAIFLLVLTAAALFCGGAFAVAEDSPDSVSQLNGRPAACIIGGIDCVIVPEKFPDSPVLYFNGVTDALMAVKSHKADYMLHNMSSVELLMKEDSDLTYIKEPLSPQPIGFFFAKDDPESDALRALLDEFILANKDSFEDMRQAWIDGTAETVPDLNPGAPNGTVVFGCVGSLPPYTYLAKDGITGFDIEVLSRFCKEYGYSLEIRTMDIGGLIPALQSGSIDVAGGGLGITEERKQAVSFAVSHISDPYVAVVRSRETAPGLFGSIKQSFTRSFITENRWAIMLGGIRNTLEIAALSAIFGTAAGFVLFIISRKGYRIFNRLLAFFSWLSGGLPVVTVLLIMYYVVFIKTGMSGKAVSVVSFSLILAASCCSALTTAVKSVSSAQVTNAACLGFSDNQTLRYFLLPQASVQFIPVYKTQLIQLIHATAMSGYIAVQDLTKASDLIRSVTYEAFMPLLLSAVVYLALDALLVRLISLLERLADPTYRTDEQVLRKFR